MRTSASTEIDAPRDVVWAYVTDPDRTAAFMAGVTRWQPVAGEPRTGERARYHVLMEVGSAEVGGVVEVVEWDPPGDMAWVSITGPSQRGRWRLRDRRDGRTELTLLLNYQAPGGLLGLVADRISGPLVSRNLRRTVAGVRRHLEDPFS